MSSSNNSQGEQYNLRWNNYFTNLVQVFTELRQKEQMVDVTLVCEDQQIKAHKIILSACSDFFMDLFQSLNEAQPVIIFHEIKFVHLIHIIQFIYNGEVKVLDLDLEGVLNLGEKFRVKGLSSVKLKHKVTPTSGSNEADISKKENCIKYEMKLFGKSLVTDTTQTNLNETIKSPKVEAKPETKNKLKDELDTSRPLKKKKISPAPIVYNSMIKEKRDKPISPYETGEPTPRTDNKSPEKQLKSNFRIKIKQTVDLIEKHANNSQEKSEKVESQKKSITNPNVPKDKPKIIKPINAFILFSKEWRKKLEVEHPNEDYKSISVRLSNLWKTLSSETKESYYMTARQQQLNNQTSDSINGSLSIF